jgi:hypothetical protein
MPEVATTTKEIYVFFTNDPQYFLSSVTNKTKIEEKIRRMR